MQGQQWPVDSTFLFFVLFCNMISSFHVASAQHVESKRNHICLQQALYSKLWMHDESEGKKSTKTVPFQIKVRQMCLADLSSMSALGSKNEFDGKFV